MPLQSNQATIGAGGGLWKDPWFAPNYVPTDNPAVNPLTRIASQDITPSQAKAKLFREKLFHMFQGGQLRFLPMTDGVTEETPEMRSEYIKMFLKEPSIKAALLTKVIAVASMKWSVLPSSDDPRDKRIAEWVDYCIRSCQGGLRKICENVLLFGLVNGQSLNEKVYDHVKTKKFSDLFPDGYVTNVKKIKVKENLDYRLEVDQFRNVKSIWSHQAARRFDPSYFVLFNFMPMYENPAGTSDLRAAIRAYNIINMAHQFRAIYLEQFSLPVMKGVYSDPKDTEMKEFLEAAIQDVRSLGWFTVPEGVTIEAMNVAARGDSEFNETIEDLRKEIYLCLVGSYLQAMEGDTPGGAGSSSVHKSTQELFIWYLTELLADAINTQIIPELCHMNLSDVDPPRIQIAGVEDTELLVSAQILTTLQAAGLPLSVKETYRKFQMAPPNGDSDKLMPAQQPGGDMGMGGGEPPLNPLQGGPDKGGVPSVKSGLSGLTKNLLPKTSPDNMSEAEGDAEEEGLHSYGPQALWFALDALGVAKLNVVSLAKEMGVDGDGKIDYGTLFRIARYHGLSCKIIDGSNEDAMMSSKRGASVFDIDANSKPEQSVVITAIDMPGSPSSFVTIDSIDIMSNRINVEVPMHGMVSMKLEDFLADWPAKRKVLVVALDKGDDTNDQAHPLNQMSEVKKKETDDGDVEEPVSENDYAPAGPDGKAIAKLLNESVQHGSTAMSGIVKDAIERLLNGGEGHDGGLLNQDELRKFSESLTEVCAPADLLGRSVVHRRADRARRMAEGAGYESFSETDSGLMQFAEGKTIRPMGLGGALDFFKNLIPKMNVNPTLWGKTLKRKVFTMAEASNKRMLKKAHTAIATAMKGGESVRGGTNAVQDVLDAFGVTPKNPQYAEMVYRTNMMDALTQAAEDERMSKDMIDDFPAWRYDGIRDGRQGKDHEPHFGKYYPASASFKDVRGPRVFNCRCIPTPVYKTEWAALRSRGKKATKFSEGCDHVSFSEYHGPNPPGGSSYWVQKGTGPRGGKIWQRKTTSKLMDKPVEKAIKQLEFKVEESQDSKWESPEHIDGHRQQFVDAYEKGQGAFERVAIEVHKLTQERLETTDSIKKCESLQKMDVLMKALIEHDRKLSEFDDHAAQAQRDVFLHTFGVSKEKRHEFEIDSDNDSPKILSQVTRCAEFIEQLTNKAAMQQEITSKDSYLGTVAYQGPAKIDFEVVGSSYHRAFARKTNTGATIAVANGDEDRVIVHEIGHFVEYYLTPEAKAKIDKFRESRFGKDKAEYRQLGKLFPKSGFSSHEVTMWNEELHDKGAFNYNNYQRFNPDSKEVKGSPDQQAALVAAVRTDQQNEQAKRRAAYVGKIYGSGATEIVSMGLELLHEAPAHFAKADPEYFNMLIDVLQNVPEEKKPKKTGKDV